MADNKNQLQPEHLEQSHSAVSSFVEQIVLLSGPAAISSILSDPQKKKKARKVLKDIRDVLNNANLDS